MRTIYKGIHAVLTLSLATGAIGALIEPRMAWLCVFALGGWTLLCAVYVHRSILAAAILWAMASIAFPPAAILGVVVVTYALLYRKVSKRLKQARTEISGGSNRDKNADTTTDAFGNDMAKPDYIWGIHSRNPGFGHTFFEDDR